MEGSRTHVFNFTHHGVPKPSLGMSRTTVSWVLSSCSPEVEQTRPPCICKQQPQSSSVYGLVGKSPLRPRSKSVGLPPLAVALWAPGAAVSGELCWASFCHGVVKNKFSLFGRFWTFKLCRIGVLLQNLLLRCRRDAYQKTSSGSIFSG